MNEFFIADFIPFSLLDYQGKIASVVFTHGCGLRCRYCHNPELVTGRRGDNRLNEFMDFIRDKDIEGIAVTGGEPLAADGILTFLAHVKGLGYSVKLDTNGFSHAALERAAGYLDFVSVDLKAFNDADIAQITRTGGGLEHFYRTIDVLRVHGISFEVRHTLWKVPEAADVKRVMERAGLERITVQHVIKKGKWLDRRFQVSIDRDEVLELFAGYDVVWRN